MVEKYEALAYLKFKGEEKKDEKNKIAKLLSLLGSLIFKNALTDIYNEGMKYGCGDPEFMSKLTDFFVASTASFYYAPNKSKEEIVKETSLFLDAVKQDIINAIKNTFELKEEIKF